MIVESGIGVVDEIYYSRKHMKPTVSTCRLHSAYVSKLEGDVSSIELRGGRWMDSDVRIFMHQNL